MTKTKLICRRMLYGRLFTWYRVRGYEDYPCNLHNYFYCTICAIIPVTSVRQSTDAARLGEPLIHNLYRAYDSLSPMLPSNVMSSQRLFPA